MSGEVDVVEVEGGKVSLQYLAPGVVLATSGLDVGWLEIDGLPRYAARRFALEDGAWVASEKQFACQEVEPGRRHVASEKSPPDVRDKAAAILLSTVAAWHAARPDMAAKAVLDAARDALRRHGEDVDRTRSHLAVLEGRTAALEARVADALGAVEAAASPDACHESPGR